MVVNMIRVVCLWLWIIFSPGIVLINIFGMKVSDQLDKYLSWQNILGLIMQPVAVVGMLSVGLIFIIELASIFNLCVKQQDNSPLAVRTISEGIDAPIGELLNPI
jgi:TRAP-type C4-dicarboxylate transport system permease small subunit